MIVALPFRSVNVLASEGRTLIESGGGEDHVDKRQMILLVASAAPKR